MRRVITISIGMVGAVSAVSADLVTKKFFYGKPDLASGFSFFYGFIRSTVHPNTGAVGDTPIPMWIIMILSIFILIFLLFGLVRASSPLNAIALGLVLGGAVGNLFDRIVLGYVRDWILLDNLSAINFADVFILAGIILWIVKIFHSQKSSTV